MTAIPTLDDTRPVQATTRVCPVQTTPFALSYKLKMRLWALLMSTLFRWSPVGARGFRRRLLQWFGAKLASTASIHNTARIDCPWNLEMGPYASIGEGAWVYTLDKIVIGEYACIGQFARLLTGTHDILDPTFPLITKPIVIGYGAWVAVGAIVLPGVHIGALSVIGAGAVVTKDMPEGMICAGNPCKPIKPRQFRDSQSPDMT